MSKKPSGPETEGFGRRKKLILLLAASLLFLLDIFADIHCNRSDDNKTLYDEVVVRVDSKELKDDLQKLEYEHAD